jgi:tetratricopeptide (TPR) repeat protein
VNLALEFSARVLRFELGYEASPPQLSMAADDLQRALAIAHETASVWQEIHIEGDLAALEAALGNTQIAIERLQKLARRAEALGMCGDRARFLHNLAALLLRAGRAREAAETAAEVTRLGIEAGDPGLGSTAWSLRADALRRLGELDAALLSIDEAIRLQNQRGDRMVCLSLLRRAEILSAQGRASAAQDDVFRCRDLAAQQGERGFTYAAELWLSLERARAGIAAESEVNAALANLVAAGNTRGAFIKTLMERAQSWLQGHDV